MTESLTENQLENLKTILLNEQKKLLQKQSEFSVGDLNLDIEDRSDEVDQANADVTNCHELRFKSREFYYEKKIAHALQRMEKGVFGVCLECEEPIKYERLVARPTADLCVSCKEESERDEYSNAVGRQSKSVGKNTNLIMNF